MGWTLLDIGLTYRLKQLKHNLIEGSNQERRIEVSQVRQYGVLYAAVTKRFLTLGYGADRGKLSTTTFKYAPNESRKSVPSNAR